MIDELLTEDSMEYLINIGIKGLKRVLKNKKFTESEYTNREFEEYKNEIDPVDEYLETLNRDMIINETVKVLFNEYTQYCISEGYDSVSNIAFSKKVATKFNLTSKIKKVGGKATRVYIEKGNS